MDRIIAASLIPLTVAPFAGGSFNPVMDAVLCGTLIIHSHMGFQYAALFLIRKVPSVERKLTCIFQGLYYRLFPWLPSAEDQSAFEMDPSCSYSDGGCRIIRV